jgi:exo-beta-1,3-glucanase (GH17 family)
MARIKIEDLRPIETLTREEQEEILGAGRFCFRPEFEALESREMMDAGMGMTLQTMLIQSPGLMQAGHQAGMVQPYNPVAEASMTGMQRGLTHQNRPPMMTSQTGQVADLRNMGVVDALNKGANWILYEPVTSSSGAYVSKEQIKNELQFLYNKGFRGIVTYAFNNGREEIPVIAKEIGFHQVIAGFWCSGGAFAGEKANLTADRMKAIDGYCVGNETQLRRVENQGDRGLSLGDLQGMIQQVKDMSGKPVATSDAWNVYVPGEKFVPGLMQTGDWVFPNLHPWFEQGWAPAHQDPSKAMDFLKNVMNEQFNSGKTGGKAVILHEVWWPSQNDGAYVPDWSKTDDQSRWKNEHNYFGAASPEKQRDFFQALNRNGFKFVYGEAFDQSWKSEGDASFQGKFGQHWGLWSGVNGDKLVNGVINYGYR